MILFNYYKDMLIDYKNKSPLIGNDTFIAEGAKIIGDVSIGNFSSIWFNVVIRGDVASVRIGNSTNIQDNTVIHTSRFNGVASIGDNVTIGHCSILHACIVQDYGFVGMGSIILDKAIVESYGFVAAGALVTSNTIIKSYELWGGRPARFMRQLREDEIEYIKQSALNYQSLANDYQQDEENLPIYD